MLLLCLRYEISRECIWIFRRVELYIGCEASHLLEARVFPAVDFRELEPSSRRVRLFPLPLGVKEVQDRAEPLAVSAGRLADHDVAGNIEHILISY